MAAHRSPEVLATRALSALREGEVTQVVVDAVTRSATNLARSGQFSTPGGAREWSAHDVDDLVGDFFTRPGRVEALAERAGDGPDAVRRFRRALQKSLKRVIIDRFHATPRGVLSRRIDRRMKARGDVVDVLPDHWSLDPHKDEPHWGGSEAVFVEALSVVVIDPPPAWPEDSPRDGPATSTESVDGACTKVLSVAMCPVETGTVRRVVVERILQFDPGEVYEEFDRGAPQSDEGWVPSPNGMRDAELFWESLDGDDRVLLPRLLVSARQLEEEGFLSLKKSAIDARQRKLRLRLLELGSSTPHGLDAARHVVEVLCPMDVAGHGAGGER